jgi:hypothetical protein
MFDVRVGQWWLQRADVHDVAQKLGLDVVPVLGEGTLHDAVAWAKRGIRSTWGDFEAEGITIDPLDPFPHTNRASKLESAFRQLWDSLNAKRGYGWDENPWVWRIEFRRVMPNASLTGAKPAGEASGRSDSSRSSRR